MNTNVKTLPESQVEIEVTLTPEEIKPHLERAAKGISEKRSIKGFRPGNAPYDKVVQEVGEMVVYEAALEKIVQFGYYEATKKEKLKTIGMPEISVKKFAPGNDITFTAKAAVLPEVKLPALDKIKVETKDATVDDKQVDETLDNLRKMRGTEVAKDGEATKEDKVVVDMDLLVDNVPVEGGQTKNHGVYLSEEYYVPGFQDKLVGAKKGDDKDFTLDFPKDHYQKHLAGKTVQFKVKVLDVFERQFPALDDEFAKSLGQESVEQLKTLLKENMNADAAKKEEERQEIAMLEAIMDKTTYGEIPTVLLDAEKRRIAGEFASRLEQQGMKMEDYLASINKTQEELVEGYVEQAEKRVKTTLLLREYAEQENIEASKEAIENEVEQMKAQYKDNKDVLKQIDTQDTRESLKTILRNRQAVLKLKEVVLGKAEAAA